MSTSNLLLKEAIDYSIDLWVFKELFIGTKNDYETYLNMWWEITRVKLTKEKFKYVVKLLERYLKEQI